MKISELVKILNKAKKSFGDVDIKLVDHESGYYVDVETVYKIHPLTGAYGCMNRNDPVNGVVISDMTNGATDLNLG